MSSKPSRAKGKEKTTEPERSTTSADTTKDGEDRHQSEQWPTAEERQGDGARVGSNILILSEAQAWNALDPREHLHVLRLFDNPEVSNNPGAYCLFIETRADGSTKAQIYGPFDTNSMNEGPSGASISRSEPSGTNGGLAVEIVAQDTSGLRLDPNATISTIEKVAGTSGGAAQIEQPRTLTYTPEQHLWMNDWCRTNRSIKHRDITMAAAFKEKFDIHRSEPAMKARFQALNESGHLDGPQKDLKFYQDRANEPKKRADNQRSRRSQINVKALKPTTQGGNGAEDGQDFDKVMEAAATKPQQSRKRDRSVMDVTERIDLHEEVDMDTPPPKKACRTKSERRPRDMQVRGSESPSEEEEEPYMPRNLGPTARPKSYYPMTKRSGPQLLSALPEGESAVAVPSGPMNSISPNYQGRIFTAINAPANSVPAEPSSFTAGGTALLPRSWTSGVKTWSGEKASRGGSVCEDADTDMDKDQ
ncbi:hypothetical protein E6O75_ATG01163 [Venturia nashicola]|uniref:Uncharacterized protein n=1 Tax=Venturia nashicola TaxID=86259 RepID=A0A4Z1PCZ6_9PEZI|nr:hypothetical protein E6O75_ATG01163 [Venturia nashicola]